MRFAIRDDDTNYFTTPEELEHCYGNIWDTVTPSLFLISSVKGNWLYWVHQIYKDKRQTDWAGWQSDDTVYPIADNRALTAFLKDKINEGRLDVGFHAKYHRNGDDSLPQEVNNNYVRGAEFFTNRDLTDYIRTEVSQLEELLSCNISVFTPPQNLLSERGYQSVINAGLNLCGGGISSYKKQKDLRGVVNLAKLISYKAFNGMGDYPYVQRFTTHNEIIHHYPLQPKTELKSLIASFEEVRKADGDFVLSTHYAEFNYLMEPNRKMTLKNTLEELLNHVSKYNVTYTSLSELLK
jgi:hypothetical protein